MRSKLGFVVLVLMAILMLSACQPVQTVPAGGPQTYVLGVAQPFTGSLGSYGTDFGKGIELAVDQMNQQLKDAGSNVQFKIASADTQGTPDGAAKAVQTVVQSSGAHVVVGPLTTGEVLGAKQYADDNQIVLVAPASTGPDGAIPNDYIFRVMDPPDTFAGQAFIEIAKARGYQDVAILQVDNPFGNALAAIFTKGFQAAGGGEVSVIKYSPEPTDLSGEVTKLSSETARLSKAGKTAVFCICFLGDAQKALQQATVDPVLGTVDWMGVENLVSPDILSDPQHAKFLAQVKFTSVSFSDRTNPNTKPFIDAFKTKYNKRPGTVYKLRLRCSQYCYVVHPHRRQRRSCRQVDSALHRRPLHRHLYANLSGC